MNRALSGECVSPAELGAAERDRMYFLMTENYEHVTRDRFEADLDAKNAVLLLRDPVARDIRGFSTQAVFPAVVDGVRIRAIFSGDTIVAASHRGTQELVRTWLRFAGSVLAESPETPLYWMLISKGYRTYLYLPVFFRTYFPCRTGDAPHLARIADALASIRFPESYDRDAGTLRFSQKLGNLTTALAAVPPARRGDADVRFFAAKNPGFASGDELVCVAPLSPENMKGMARSLLLGGMTGKVDADA